MQDKPKPGSQGSERKKRLVLGGRTYTIDDDDISLISTTNDSNRNQDKKDKSKSIIKDSINKPKISMPDKEGEDR